MRSFVWISSCITGLHVTTKYHTIGLIIIRTTQLFVFVNFPNIVISISSVFFLFNSFLFCFFFCFLRFNKFIVHIINAQVLNIIFHYLVLCSMAEIEWPRDIHLLKKVFKSLSIYSNLVYIDCNALFYQTLFKLPITDKIEI